MANFFIEDGEKVRNAWCIVWMEDLERLFPDNPYGALLSYLEGLHVPCAASPIHCHDKFTSEDVRKWRKRHEDSKTGEVPPELEESAPKVGDCKKAHVHILFFLKGARTAEWFSDLMADIVYIPARRWEKVLHPDSAVRYLCHLDDKTKYQYSTLDVHGFGGIKLSALLRQEEFVKVQTLMYIHQYIRDNNVRHYADLVDWVQDTGDYEFVACVSGRASYFANYFRSKTEKRIEQKEREKRRKQMMEGDGDGSAA